MSKKWLWLIIVAVAVVGFTAGMVVGQDWSNAFAYLPDEYTAEYAPSVMEWREVAFNAMFNCEEPLSARLVKKTCRAGLGVFNLEVSIDTETAPGWNVYEGGRFTCGDEEVRETYQDAAEQVMGGVRESFPDITDEDISIDFHIRGNPVGTWQGGKMTLEGEE